MRVTHVGRQVIEQGVPPKDCIIISIVDPGSHPAKIAQHHLIRAIHRVEPFHDVDIEGEKILRASSTAPLVNYVTFDKVRAKKIAEFVRSFEKDMPPLIVAHCEAGICRSAGVAAALQEHYGLEGRSAYQTGLPNSLVYRLLLEALGEK